MPKYTFEELLELMDESKIKLTNMIENADKIPLKELRNDAYESFRQILHKKTDDWYTKSGNHSDISLYTAAVQLQYFLSLKAAIAFSIYLTRLENELPKIPRINKNQLLSLDTKKAIAKQVKREIEKYKRKQLATMSKSD